MFSALIILLYTSLVQADVNPTLETLAKERGWIKLGHYEKSLFGGYNSSADTKNFFLAEDGRKNPYLELEATYQAFISKSLDYSKDSAVCRFPARYMWLKQRVTLPEHDLKKMCRLGRFPGQN